MTSGRGSVMGLEIAKTLLELLQIDSDNKAEKGPIIDYAKERLLDAGMNVSVIGGGGTPAICAANGRGGLVLSGHMDTVPIGSNWSRSQGEIDGDRIYGRGASDMKGAVAAMLHAADTLCEREIPFSIFLTTDEEEGMTGALELARLPLLGEATGVIIGEPTALDLVIREKGVYRFRLLFKGKAAHSSQPWLGENAIMKMHAALSRLSDLARPPPGPAEGMTLCVSTIEGGTKNNVVPESCQAEIDIRFPPSLSLLEVRSLISERLAGLDYEISAVAELDAFDSPLDSPLGLELEKSLGADRIAVSYATEAARFAPVNANIFICGPGEPSVCHVADEWVSVSNLLRAYEMMVHMAAFAAHG